jgi:hypothetical protein
VTVEKEFKVGHFSAIFFPLNFWLFSKQDSLPRKSTIHLNELFGTYRKALSIFHLKVQNTILTKFRLLRFCDIKKEDYSTLPKPLLTNMKFQICLIVPVICIMVSLNCIYKFLTESCITSRVARSCQSFTATSARHHGHFGTFDGHIPGIVDPDPQGSGTFAGSGYVTRGFRIRVHTRKWM